MLELVDKHDSKSCDFGRDGSTPSTPTTKKISQKKLQIKKYQ